MMKAFLTEINLASKELKSVFKRFNFPAKYLVLGLDPACEEGERAVETVLHQFCINSWS